MSLFTEAARLSAIATDLPSQLRAMKLKEMAYKAKLKLDKWRAAARIVRASWLSAEREGQLTAICHV